jgi:hypothetical protein
MNEAWQMEQIGSSNSSFKLDVARCETFTPSSFDGMAIFESELRNKF